MSGKKSIKIHRINEKFMQHILVLDATKSVTSFISSLFSDVILFSKLRKYNKENNKNLLVELMPQSLIR